VAKFVVLKIGEGSFGHGFPVTLQIGEEYQSNNQRLAYCPTTEVSGKLPAAPDLWQLYQQWRATYGRLGLRSRLEAPAAQVTNFSLLEDCETAAASLRDRLNNWLCAEPFRPVREKWLEQLLPSEEIRVILQTLDPQLQQIPWHLWDLLDRYSKAELAMSLPIYERVMPLVSASPRVKVLAILGDSQGIDVQADRTLLEQLPDTEICFLVEPQPQTLTDQLWAQAWDILFFAGHSTSQHDRTSGQICINRSDRLTISQLRYGLRKAVERGLKLAIFNSCDGLGLARELADLQIPQLIVMREPVPDRVAQAFLKAFLTIFAQGEPFYLAVRQAREQLQGLEAEFPCATWLPVICQNPAETPPTWATLKREVPVSAEPNKPKARFEWRSLTHILLSSVIVTGLVSGIRYLGGLQPFELAAYDQMMRSRPLENTDPRMLIIGITEADINAQERGKGSLSDSALNQLLQTLNQYQPRVIGLDIYRDYAVEPEYPELAQQLQRSPQLIAICKANDPAHQIDGIAPPPEVPPERLGFSDFWEDADGVLRRQLLFMTPDAASPCTTPYAFSTQVAFQYLFAEGISPGFTADGNLQMGQTVFRRIQSHHSGYQRIDAQGHQILLNYRLTDAIAPQVTLTQVLSGEVNPEAVRDRIVLIGVSSEGAGDIWSTPYGSGPDRRLLGVSVQAHMISQMISAVLDQRPLIWVWHPLSEIVWFFGWAGAGAISAFFGRTVLRVGIALIVLSSLLYGICLISLIHGGWLPFVPSAIALIGTSLVVVLIPRYPSFFKS
jgi:CHASE2 domain-containing sensor protein